MQMENISWINDCARSGQGMDVVIISAETKVQEEFWQYHLQRLLGDILKPNAKVIAVCEDWHGGAGNGLGSLYAYQKAQDKARVLYGIDICDLQRKGAAIALYHTAGQGKRLSPLTGSENNNKSAVKMPAYVGRPKEYMKLLDAVIKQTAMFATSRKGRLSVFWGDQIFIPSISPKYTPKHHVDILFRLEDVPTEQQWQKEKWDQYGLIAVDSQGNPQLIDKTSYAAFQSLLATQQISAANGMGVSLGSFSLSYPMVMALLEEFRKELLSKKEYFDSDPFFWMPTTLPRETYVHMMQVKKIPLAKAEAHYTRMQNFKEKFEKQQPSLKFIGAFNIGKDSYWWDYGTVDLYFSNLMKLVEDTPEGEAKRLFFGLKLDYLTHSILLNSHITSGKPKNSLIVGSHCGQVDVDHCMILNSTLGKAEGQNCLFYNVKEKEKLTLPANSIRADVFLEERHVELTTQTGRDGKNDWAVRLPTNNVSYEEVYRLNQAVCRANSSN